MHLTGKYRGGGGENVLLEFRRLFKKNAANAAIMPKIWRKSRKNEKNNNSHIWVKFELDSSDKNPS